MREICWLESRYDPSDQNPASTAFGLWQFLDGTWQYYKIEKTDVPLLQTVAAVRYVRDRYGNGTAALLFHKQNGWY